MEKYATRTILQNPTIQPTTLKTTPPIKSKNNTLKSDNYATQQQETILKGIKYFLGIIKIEGAKW